MASFPSQDKRPIKRPRPGAIGPDVYPQEPKQKEDELTPANVKHGYDVRAPCDDETASAFRRASFDPNVLTEEKVNRYFTEILQEKIKNSTASDTGRKKLQLNIRDNFWPVSVGSKAEPWLNDLAGNRALSMLARKVPIFPKKEEIYKTLADKQVPMERAVWLIKMTNGYHQSVAESRVRNRRTIDSHAEWTAVTKDFLKVQIQKITEHYSLESPPSAFASLPELKYWQYATQLARHMFQDGLLDKHDLLSWLIEQLEKHRAADDTALKLILAQVIRYLQDVVQSQLLSRRLAYFCCKQLSSYSHDSGAMTPRTQSPMVTTAPNGAPSTGSANQAQQQTTLPSIFAEYLNCPQHRALLLTLSVIVQSITLRCPGALVWHNLGEGKMASNLSASPLDILPCAPSCLPMPYGLDNAQIRAQIRLAEGQVRLRSRMSESRWSSDKCQQSAKGFTIAKVLQVLETLDTQNFARIEIVNFISHLYTRVFGVLESKENEPPISDECIVNLLCEWAVSIQRTGEYRALVVARLLERRQHELNQEKLADEEVGDKGSEAGSELAASNSTPVFQAILLNFLDNKAPYLDDNSTIATRRAFSNLILLFSELIKHEVFSHDAYMCTLISRGDLADAPSLRTLPQSVEHADLSSVRSQLLSNKPEDSKMDVDFDVFLLKDEPKPSPSQPPSVRSEQPFSVPTPGPPHTPMQQAYGMARTPGAPTTPSMGARTPGAPHTPGAAHTPGMATTPAHGGVTPAYGSAHTPAPMQPPTPRMSVTPAAHQLSMHSVSDDTALRAKKHFSYAMHFPIAQDDYAAHECNQRTVLLYGFGRARDEVRHNIKKIGREVLKLYSKKASVDVTLGEVRKREKKKEKDKDTDSVANYEGTFQKFTRLSYYDQHAVTHQCAAQVLEMIQAFIAGSSIYLPLIEHVSYLFDLMEYCHNVSGLVEFLVQLLGELKHVHDRLQTVGSNLEVNYTTSLCLCIVSVLRRYHAYLLVMEDSTSAVFENVCQIVKHVGNPAECSSAERCTLAYLNDLFTTCADVKEKYSALFSGAAAKVKAALFARLKPTDSLEKWDTEYMADMLANPKTRIDMEIVQQLLDPSCRYSLVCNTIMAVAKCYSNTERLNDVSILCAELTSRLNVLSHEWLGVLRALCTRKPEHGFSDLLTRLDVCDAGWHESLAVFSSLLVARHCFSLQDLIIHVALPVIVQITDLPNAHELEAGARLTCHLLLGLFQSTRVLPDTRYRQPSVRCDRHLLDAAHQASKLDAIVAVLKALIELSDQISTTTKKPEPNTDIIQTLMKSLNEDDEDDDEYDLLSGLNSFNKHKSGVEQAGLAEYARYVLKEICAQDWVREKFLKKPEDLLTNELLLDTSLSNKQVQQLVHMICYPDGLPEGPSSLSSVSDEYGDEVSDQRKNIARILHNIDQWKLRVSWLELQLMFKQAPSGEMSHLLDNVAEATIDVFTAHTGKQPVGRGFLPPRTPSDADKESIWLIAPLIAKLPPNVQGRVLSAAGDQLKTGNNFWTAKNASEKEAYIQQSISLMGHQPFLSLVLTCLKGQDEKREGLLKSLHEQLEKFVNNTKEPQDRGIPTDERLKLMMQESLRLRMSLVGGMFDTIQRNSGLSQEWSMILIQLISHGVVELGNNAELFMVVLDMLSILLHGTLVADEPDGRPDTRMYSALVRKLKREVGEKQSDSMDLVRQLLPLPKHYIEVIQTEPHRTKKQQGFQVSTKQKVSPWDLLEGHKNPAPLNLSWFGGVKLERQPLRYEEQHRLLLYHTHSLKKPRSHYLDPPQLPQEDLEPAGHQEDAKPETRPLVPVIDEPSKRPSTKKDKRPKRDRPVSRPSQYPSGMAPGLYGREPYVAPQSWAGPGGYGPGPQPMQNYPQAVPPGGPRYGPALTGKHALHMHLNRRMPPGGAPYMTNTASQSPNPMLKMGVMPGRMMRPGGMSQMGMSRSMSGQAMHPGMQSFNNMGQGSNFGYHGGMEQSSGQGYSQQFQGQQGNMGMQGMGGNPQAGQYNMAGAGAGGGGQQFSNHRLQGGMASQGMGGMSGGSQMNYSNISQKPGYSGMQGMSTQQQQLRMRQLQMQHQQQQQQQPQAGGMQGQQSAALNQLYHRNIAAPPQGNQTPQHPPPPNYNQYGQYQ